MKYDRDRLAKYGISIATANRVLEAAFAGRRTGYVFEEDRRFDMVVRMDNDLRNDLVALEGLYLPLPDGGTLPFRQVAEISFEDAPAQITHEDGQRRIYVGSNVRGRDVQSTVDEIQDILDKELKLPAGYYTHTADSSRTFRKPQGGSCSPCRLPCWSSSACCMPH